MDYKDDEDLQYDPMGICGMCPFLRQNYGPPSGPPGKPPAGAPPPSHGPSGGPPAGPPPSVVPSKKKAAAPGAGVYAVSPGSLRNCLYRYVYLWLRNGQNYWAWLTYVDRRSAAGWRWNGYRWVYFGVDLRSIESFECY